MAGRLRLKISDVDQTQDRLLVRRWKGSRSLAEIGPELGRDGKWVSKWFHHITQLRDEEIDQWVAATGVSRRTFLDGRFESRNRFSAAEGDEAA